MLIVTKYHGPTNTKGSKISARFLDSAYCRLVVHFNYRSELSDQENGEMAVAKLLSHPRMVNHFDSPQVPYKAVFVDHVSGSSSQRYWAIVWDKAYEDSHWVPHLLQRYKDTTR